MLKSIIVIILNTLFSVVHAVDPDSLVDQCARKVAYYAYYRNHGYDLKALQNKLPADLNEKVASQLIAIKYKYSFKHPAITMCHEPIVSTVYCNYNRVALARNGKVLIYTIDGDNKIKSFPLCTTHKFCECGFCGETAPPLEYCGKNRLAVSDSINIKLYDIKHQTLMRKFAEIDFRPFQAFAYCRQHRLAVSRSGHGISIWNVKLGKQLMELNNYDDVTSLAYSGDNTLISHDEEKIKVWNINTVEESLSFKAHKFADGRKALAFMGNNRVANIAQSQIGAQNEIVIRDIATGDNAFAYYTQSEKNMFNNGSIININENYFAFTNGNSVAIFDKCQTKPLLKFYQKKINDILSYDNRYLIVGTAEGAVLCDLEFIIHPTLEGIIAIHKGRKWYKKITKKTLF